MFGSKKDDESGVKRRFWPWGKKETPKAEVEQQPETEDKQEPAESVAPAEPVVAVESEQSIVSEPVSAEKLDSSEPVSAELQESSEPLVTEAPFPEVPEVAEALVEKPQVETPRVETPRVETPQVEIKVAPELVSEAKPESIPVAVEPVPAPEAAPPPVEENGGFFARMKKGLSKTRAGLVDGVTTLFIGKKEIDDELLEDLETQLLISDVGIEATREIIDGLTQRVQYKELDDADALIEALKLELTKILGPADKPLVIDTSKSPFVILVVGVNGVGKTTTIGKLAKRLQQEGKSVMLAAGDTFRAAAVEQLEVWGERNSIPVVAQHTGADSASVVFDALQAAKARNVDVLIADTAGRLHNKDNLMEELAKVKRVLGKLDDEAPHEVLLVLDAGTGQNALNQTQIFNESVQLTGLALTKLDGTAKGGVTFALSQQMKLPIRFLGVGEQIDDLRPFHAREFVDALFDGSDL